MSEFTDKIVGMACGARGLLTQRIGMYRKDHGCKPAAIMIHAGMARAIARELGLPPEATIMGGDFENIPVHVCMDKTCVGIDAFVSEDGNLEQI